MATQAKITHFDNASLRETLRFVDRGTGTAYDFTGSTFKMDVRTSADAVSATLSLTTANGGIVSTDLDEGTIQLVVDAGDIAAGSYVYDLIRVNGSDEEMLMFGEYIVEPGVTE